MAIIYSYPQATPKPADLLIGTVTYDGTGAYPVEGNPTRTFSVQDIADLASSYTLTTQQNGTSSTLTLRSDAGSLSVVNLIRGNGISLNSNGSNTITIGNLGVLSANASNTNFINMAPSAASTGNVTFSASLSASGTPSSLSFLRGDNIWAIPAGGGTVTSVNAGTGIAVNNTNPEDPIISNTGVLSNIAGAGISISGATGNSTITNTAPDQTVVLTGAGGTTITGTYPNFTVSSSAGGGGVDSVVGGTSITVNNADPLNPIINNSSPDQTVVLNNGTGITTSGTYPNFTITNSLPDQTVAIAGGGATTVTGTYPNFNITSTDTNTQYTAGSGLALIGQQFSNTSPDQTVALTGSGAATVTGTYPSFNVATPVVNTADFITNANDVYPSVNKVTDIISLTQAEYNALTPDQSAIYVIIG